MSTCSRGEVFGSLEVYNYTLYRLHYTTNRIMLVILWQDIHIEQPSNLIPTPATTSNAGTKNRDQCLQVKHSFLPGGRSISRTPIPIIVVSAPIGIGVVVRAVPGQYQYIHLIYTPVYC